jgi:hypothetical protein
LTKPRDPTSVFSVRKNRISPIDPEKVRTIVNPCGIGPLAAVIDISPETGISKDHIGKKTATLTDAMGGTETFAIPCGSPEYEANYGVPDIAVVSRGGVVAPVLGLYADTTTSIRVTTKYAKEAEPGMTLLSFSVGNSGRFVTRPIIIDACGDVGWVLRLDSLGERTSPVESLENGNLVLR